MSQFIRVIQNGTQLASYTDPENAVRHAVQLLQDSPNLTTVSLQKFVMDKPQPLRGKIISIDPGHGGTDPGAVRGDAVEKTLNLNMSLAVAAGLAKLGATVSLTRDKDITLTRAERIGRVRDSGAHLSISDHHNAFNDPRAEGIETYVAPNADANSRRFAAIVQRNMIAATGARNRGVKEGNFYMVTQTGRPSVLLEYGFISNPAEQAKLLDKTYQARLAKAVVDAVVEYYEHHK